MSRSDSVHHWSPAATSHLRIPQGKQSNVGGTERYVEGQQNRRRWPPLTHLVVTCPRNCSEQDDICKSRPPIQVAFIPWFLRYLFHKAPQSWIARHRKMQGLLVGVLYLVAEHGQKMLPDESAPDSAKTDGANTTISRRKSSIKTATCSLAPIRIANMPSHLRNARERVRS